MTQTDLQSMSQTTISLVTILRHAADRDGPEVMSDMMRFDRALSRSIDAVSHELRGDRAAQAIEAAINRPMSHALRFGAEDLVEVGRKSFENFTDIPDGQPLTPEAAADTMAWLSVARQTQVALRVLFQASTLFGRAPNGASLPRPAVA